MIKFPALIGLVSCLVSGNALANNPILDIANALAERALVEFNQYVDEQISSLPGANVKPIHLSGVRYNGKCAIEKNIHLMVCDEVRVVEANNYEIVINNVVKAYINQVSFEMKNETKKLPEGVSIDTYIGFISGLAKNNMKTKMDEIIKKYKLNFFGSSNFVYITEDDIGHLSSHYSKVANKEFSVSLVIGLINCKIREGSGALHFDELKSVLINNDFFKTETITGECTDNDPAVKDRMSNFIYKFSDDIIDLVSEL